MSLPGFFYFISTFKAPTAPPLDHPEFFSIVTAELKHLERDHLLACMAMVLMPDHLHMIIRLGNQASLSQVIKLFKGRTAHDFNQRRQASGSIWYKSFHDRMIRSSQSLAAWHRYVLRNPVRAQLVATPEDWPYLIVKDEIQEFL